MVKLPRERKSPSPRLNEWELLFRAKKPKDKTPGPAWSMLSSSWVLANTLDSLDCLNFNPYSSPKVFRKCKQQTLSLKSSWDEGMHRAPAGRAVTWPHSMGINAKALICSRPMIRALGLILGEELSFSDWQPELFITQIESQSSALQVTNQSQALRVGKEGEWVWNGQQQFAKMKPKFCLSPPAHPGAAPRGF